MAFFHSATASSARAVLAQGSRYPAPPRIREVSAHIAAAVAKVAYQRGLATGKPPNNLPASVNLHRYDPRY